MSCRRKWWRQEQSLYLKSILTGTWLSKTYRDMELIQASGTSMVRLGRGAVIMSLVLCCTTPLIMQLSFPSSIHAGRTPLHNIFTVCFSFFFNLQLCKLVAYFQHHFSCEKKKYFATALVIECWPHSMDLVGHERPLQFNLHTHTLTQGLTPNVNEGAVTAYYVATVAQWHYSPVSPRTISAWPSVVSFVLKLSLPNANTKGYYSSLIVCALIKILRILH